MEPYRLFVLHVDSGKVEKLLEGVVGTFYWSADSRTIVHAWEEVVRNRSAGTVWALDVEQALARFGK